MPFFVTDPGELPTDTLSDFTSAHEGSAWFVIRYTNPEGEIVGEFQTTGAELLRTLNDRYLQTGLGPEAMRAEGAAFLARFYAPSTESEIEALESLDVSRAEVTRFVETAVSKSLLERRVTINMLRVLLASFVLRQPNIPSSIFNVQVTYQTVPPLWRTVPAIPARPQAAVWVPCPANGSYADGWMQRWMPSCFR